MQLFGFLTGDELEVFRLLITVNGIGPKGGLGILSALSADELRFAVMAGDVKAITAAPGIGKKTAERLILDLKDKLKMEDILERQPEEADLRSGTVGNDVQTEMCIRDRCISSLQPFYRRRCLVFTILEYMHYSL